MGIMRLYRTVFALLAAASWLSASTIFTLGANHNQNYGGEAVGPYYGSLAGYTDALFFCLDQNLPSAWNTAYAGDVHTPWSAQEQEAAFLASYSLAHGAPGSSASEVNNVEGPVSMAIWQIMGHMESPIDPKAQPLVAMAEYAYTHNMITQSYLSHVLIFQPATVGTQRFITAYRDDTTINQITADISAVPETATAFLFAGGLVMLAAFERRMRKLRVLALASRTRP
jgi:hypothetical protein